MITSHERRIARNTMFLYVRMVLTVVVSLYTSRVVLETLGVDNFGIYNLVGGIVTIFSFLNGTMSAATMRFLNFEMGAGSPERLKRTFATALSIHIIIATVLVVLAETIGLWYVNTHLVIAPERMVAANWTYQMSIIATIITIVQIPYTSAIMAHEHMGAYAKITLTFTFLKLGIVLLLLWVTTADTLVAYSALYTLCIITIGLTYAIYAYRHFAESRCRPRLDKAMARSMLAYSGWDTFGNLAYTGRLQGANIILNNFGGTVLNAAASLALTVCSTLQQFAVTVVSAFRPQIVQQYAKGDFAFMLRLLYNAGKFSNLLLLMLAIPIYVEMPYVLSIWLKDVPAHTVDFCRICLIATVGDQLKMVIDSGIHATGRIMRLSFISGAMLLAELPAMYWLLKYTENPNIVYVVHAVWIFFILMAESLILKYQLPEYSIRRFWLKAVILPLLLAAPALAATQAISIAIMPSLPRLLLCCTATVVILAAMTYFVGIDHEMQATIRNRIKSYIHRK